MKIPNILLGHGSGGLLSHELISSLFLKYFGKPADGIQTDAAVIPAQPGNIAFTTDSFVVTPIFFPGGNIGKLAVCGTVNDLSVSGAVPAFLSTAFIIEEGMSFDDLEIIVHSMAEEAEKAGVKIITGDTKVVNKGSCDKLFINTTGIGFVTEKNSHIGSGSNISEGDVIIINGQVGDHGMAIMAARNEMQLQTPVTSDCACLNHLIAKAMSASDKIKFMRDATRGGLATVLCELTMGGKFGIEVEEELIPVNETIRGLCEILGFDPLYVANEGKIVMVVAKEDAPKVLEAWKNDPLAKGAAVIGNVTTKNPGRVWLQTQIGGKRIIDMLAGEQLPRIC